MNAEYILLLLIGALLVVDHGVSFAHFPRIHHRHMHYPDRDTNPRQHSSPTVNDTAAVRFARYRRDVTAERAKQLAELRMKNLKGMEQELLVMLNIDTKWEQYLLPMPMAVATLGQLVVISSKRDCRLKNVNEGKFVYLKHMHFRPMLVQTVNEAWKAFLLANRNIERIKLSTAELARSVKEALKILRSPKPEVITKFLPNSLDGVETAAKECVHYAIEIDDVFIKMVELLDEIDNAIAATDGFYRGGLLNIMREKEVLKEERKLLKPMRKRAKKRFAEVSRRLYSLNLQEIDSKETRQILEEGISGVANLNKQVDRGIRFFQIISGVASVTLQGAATSFVANCRQHLYDPETGKQFLYDDPTFAYRDILVFDASRIATVSEFLSTLSDVFLFVSNKHIMDRLATVSGLQIVEDSQKERTLRQLLVESESSQADILQIVNEKRRAFKRAISRSKIEIAELFSSLGKPSQAELNSIDSAKTVVNVQTELEHSPYESSCLVGC